MTSKENKNPLHRGLSKLTTLLDRNQNQNSSQSPTNKASATKESSASEGVDDKNFTAWKYERGQAEPGTAFAKWTRYTGEVKESTEPGDKAPSSAISGSFSFKDGKITEK